MRYYMSGVIELSKEIPEEEIGYTCGGIFKRNGKYVYELHYNEYLVDYLEDELDALCRYAQENGITLKGSIEGECDGEDGGYFFNGNGYEEFWGNAYHIHQMLDEELIGELIDELKKRGYTVTKNG